MSKIKKGWLDKYGAERIGKVILYHFVILSFCDFLPPGYDANKSESESESDSQSTSVKLKALTATSTVKIN